MSNIVPASEGFVDQATYDAVRKEVRDVFLPLLDGFDVSDDALALVKEGLEGANAVRGLPENVRMKVLGSIVISIGNEIQEDLVVIYPEEA